MGGEEEEEEGGFGIIFVVDCGEEYVYVVCGGVRVASRDEMVGGGWWGGINQLWCETVNP
uniref:Uncharacterized protein n=1 Tax=Oryza glumipatula TaxID=40148 RepID=A0A0D9YYD0_9ORYZ